MAATSSSATDSSATVAKLVSGRTIWTTVREWLNILGRLLVGVGFIVVFLLVPVILERNQIILQASFVDYLAVMLLGALVGFVEVVSRYQDAPFRTAVTWPGMLYMLINAFVAAGALWLIRLFGWEFTVSNTTQITEETTRWTQVLTAGLGAMAIFRSSLFVLGKEGNEVSVGPSAVLQILLAAIDREVDRQRGQDRAGTVGNLKRIAYESVKGELLLLSQRLMQNLSDSERKAIVEAIREIEIESADPEVRKYMLGLKIIEFVGPDVLKQAIEIRGEKYYNAIFDSSKPVEKPSVIDLREIYGASPANVAAAPIQSISSPAEEQLAKG